METMTQFLVDPERSLICLEMQKSLLMKTNKELLFIVAGDIERWSDYGQVSEVYSAGILKNCVQR